MVPGRSAVARGLALLAAQSAVAPSAWNATGGAACVGASAAEYVTCMACGVTCDQALIASCDVEVPALSGRWQKAHRTVASECTRNMFCEELLLEISESEECCPLVLPGESDSCQFGYPRSGCSAECGAGYYMEFGQECLERNFKFNESNGVAFRMMTQTYGDCRASMLFRGAQDLYANSKLAYIPYGGLLMFLLPLAFFSIFIFFGKQLSTMFRMLVGGTAMGFAIAWPSVAPFFTGCAVELDGIDVVTICEETPAIDPAIAITLALAVLTFCQSAYTCRQVPAFGNAVQGFSLGVVFIILVLNMLIGGMTETSDTSWLILGMYVTMGTVGAVFNIFMPDFVNTVASVMIGTYVCCQIVCMIGYFEGWFFTFPVSVMAASMGVSGCQEGGCWLYLVFWILVGILGCYSQQAAVETAAKVGKGEAAHGCMGKMMYLSHQAVALVLELEDSMAEHAEYHTKEEMVELADHHASTWAKVATFTSDTCLMMFGISLFIGAIELFIRVPVKAWSLGFYICGSSIAAMVLTLYEMSIHSTNTTSSKVAKFDIYIWGVFVLVPVSVMGFLLCMTLGMESDPFGLHDNFGVTPDLLFDTGTDIEDAHRTIFLRHMQAASFAFAGLTVSACMTATYVSRHLGGLLYLALKTTKFVAILLVGYGGLLIAIGVFFIPKEGTNISGEWLYTMIAVVGVLECLTGVLGVAGACAHSKAGDEAKEMSHGDAQADAAAAAAFARLTGDGDAKEGDDSKKGVGEDDAAEEKKEVKSLKGFLIALTFIMFLNICVFVSAGMWASDVQTMSHNDWLAINGTNGPLQSYCNQAGTELSECMVTREEFVHDITASFQLLMAVGITTIVYMMVGLGAGAFVLVQKPGVLSHAEEMVQKHAKGYLDQITVAELRTKSGKESGLAQVETLKAVKAAGPPSPKGKKKVRKKVKPDPNETAEEKAARKAKHKQDKLDKKNGGPVVMTENPVSDAGAVFDVEDFAPTVNGNGAQGEYDDDVEESDGDSSEYEWNTTDTEEEDLSDI